MAGDTHGDKAQEEPEAQEGLGQQQAVQDQPQVSSTDWEKAVAERDEKIAALEARVAEAAGHRPTGVAPVQSVLYGLPLPPVQPAVRLPPLLLCQLEILSLGRAGCPPLGKGCTVVQDSSERVRMTIEKRTGRSGELATQHGALA